MRRSALRLLLVAPLVAGCLPKDEPLAPELKGRWAAPNASKVRAALRADRMSNPVPVSTATKNDADCRDHYVTFGKRGIALHIDQNIQPLFAVRDIKRDGSRLILTGSAPVPGGSESKIELLLRNGEIRFDDIMDQRGRSIRYDRFDNEQARRVGITTIGDIFRLVLDLKPCQA